MGELGNWGRSNNRYITLKDGESLEAVFEGARITQSSFDPEKETIQYKFDGKLFNTASRKLATQMDDIAVGTKIRLTRMGEKNKTRYHVEIIGESE